MVLCSSCQAFDIQTFKKAPLGMRGYEQRSVEQAALAGCTFCGFLCENLSAEMQRARAAYGDKSWVHMRMSRDHESSSAAKSKELGCNTLDIIIAPQDLLVVGDERIFDDCGDRCIIAPLELRVVAEQDSPAALNGDIVGRYLGDDPASEIHLQAIRQWLDECLSKHPQCRRTASGAEINAKHVQLPTRCIDVTGNTLKLRDTSQTWSSYITLSHRWTEQTYKSRTVESIVGARTEEIDLSSLPKTLQDAISITRRLEVPYLWVDSLCIIQGDDGGADWLREAPNMGQYFQNSLFTLSATGASNRKGGCFQERPPGIVGPLVRLPYRDPQGRKMGHFYVHKRETSATQEYIDRVNKTELMTRGWVLQERLLSRRVIHFTESQLFFECATHNPRSECMETVFVDPRSRCMSEITHTPSVDVSSLWHSGKTPFIEISTWETSISHSDHWYSIVEQFSAMALTKPAQDRLAAVAGIVGEFQKILERDHADQKMPLYLAGLWLHDIHYGLLWESCHEGERPQLSGCETPSWSWATYMSPVCWHGGSANTEKSCDIIGLSGLRSIWHDAEAKNGFRDLPTTGSFGVLTASIHLKIRGNIQPIMLSGAFSDDHHEHLKTWTGIDRSVRSHQWQLVYDLDGRENHGWASIDNAAAAAEYAAGKYLVLPTLHVSTTTGVPGGIEFGYFGFTHHVYNFLLLRQVDHGRFQRLGMGKIFTKNFFKDASSQEVVLV